MVYECAAMSHIGCKRKNNQDNYYLNGVCRRDVKQDIFKIVEHQERASVIAGVFDGAGGAQHGEIASLLAVASIEQYGQDISMDTVLQEYIPIANAKIVNEAQKIDGVMATTMALLLLDGGMASVCNLGDSRVYLYRDRRLMQLTYDHTQAQLIQEKMANHPQGQYTEQFQCRQHVLTKYLGMDGKKNLQPYYNKNISVMEGDIFLLCSDGLYNMLQPAKLSEHMENIKQNMPEEIASFLIEKALIAGGDDNITCMAIKALRKGSR